MKAQFGQDRKIYIDATGPKIIVKLLFCNAVIGRVSTRDMETLAKRKEPWMEPVIQLCTQPEAQLDPYVPPVPPISLNVFEAIEALNDELESTKAELRRHTFAPRFVLTGGHVFDQERQCFLVPETSEQAVKNFEEDEARRKYCEDGLPSTQPDGNMATAEPESILPSEY